MIRPILDNRKRKNGLCPIYIEFREAGRRKLHPVGIAIEKKFWGRDKVKSSHPNATEINEKIARVMGQTIAGENDKPQRIRITDIIRQKAIQYEKRDKIVMWRKCLRLIRELDQFSPGMYLDQLTDQLVDDFDTFLFRLGNCDTTRSKKLKLYGFVIGGTNPFRNRKVRERPSNKVKLEAEELSRIESIQLNGPVATARDIFMFSFYCKGQRFSDCVTARWNQIQGGRIHFTQDKTGKHISVKIHAKLAELIARYEPHTDYIFPFLVREPKTELERISKVGTFNAIVNRHLKVLAGLAQTRPFAFHTARHTFAYLLMCNHADIHVIRDAMGHSDYKTTKIYLGSLGDERLDREMDALYGKNLTNYGENT